MRRKEGWGKTVFAFLAVTAALAGTFGPPPKRSVSQRPPYQLPPASAVLAGITIDETLGTYGVGFANAFLVDAGRGLFATSAHVVEGADALLVAVPGHGSLVMRFPPQWRNDLADLAVGQVEGPHPFAGIAPYRIAAGPPRAGETLTVLSYEAHLHFMGTTFVRAKRKSFRTERSAGDGCVNPGTCRSRDRMVEDLLAGKQVAMDSRRFLYPRYIYVTRIGQDRRSIIPGMSGSPAFDGSGAVTGVVAAYYTFDQTGSHGRFAPAYLLRDLLARVQVEIDTEKK